MYLFNIDIFFLAGCMVDLLNRVLKFEEDDSLVDSEPKKLAGCIGKERIVSTFCSDILINLLMVMMMMMMMMIMVMFLLLLLLLLMMVMMMMMMIRIR